MRQLQDTSKIPYARLLNSVYAMGAITLSFHAVVMILVLFLTGCSSAPQKTMLTLPATDEQGRSLAYVSESNYGPKGCGAAITPTGGKVWIYTLDCFWNCSQAQENLGITSPTLCQQICK